MSDATESRLWVTTGVCFADVSGLVIPPVSFHRDETSPWSWRRSDVTPLRGLLAPPPGMRDKATTRENSTQFAGSDRYSAAS